MLVACADHRAVTIKASIYRHVWAGWCGERLSDIAGRTDI